MEGREAPHGLLKASTGKTATQKLLLSVLLHIQILYYRSALSGEWLLMVSGVSAGVTFEPLPSILDNVRCILISQISHLLGKKPLKGRGMPNL